jgi:hypothetical protein
MSRTRPGVDPWRPIDVLPETERLPDGRQAPALTVFLAGAECPFSCVYCDLWRHTLDGPTPLGAIPAQIRQALERFDPPPETVLKLYNASNFFDDRAVPPADDGEILSLVAPFARVAVECHPRLVRGRALDYARRLDGRLQVAMGLETVHPEALPRLAKKMTLDDFDAAAATLRAHGAGVRVFVLAGAPFVPPDESATWTVRSVEHALSQGAEHVAIIPLRSDEEGFHVPSLDEVEDAVDRCCELGLVTVDLWDVERLAACPTCFPRRRARLERMNASGRPEPRVVCAGCRTGRSAA